MALLCTYGDVLSRGLRIRAGGGNSDAASSPSQAFAQCRGDKASKPPQVDSSGPYTFAYFRVDELGRRMYCDEVTNITKVVHKAPGTAGPLVVVYVHGWKHDASPDDPDVLSFRAVLKELVTAQATQGGVGQRRVVGVYVGWPANPGSMLGLENVTFWDTKLRADDIASNGEVSKLLDHLNANVRDNDGLLVVIGHSFGARLVFEAVHQTIGSKVIEEGRARPGEAACSGNVVCHRIRGLGDLVVLLNPAFEAARYTTYFQYGGGNARHDANIETWQATQPPLVLTIGAENDVATKTYWKWAHLGSDPAKETTLTNYVPYLTHELRCVETSGVPLNPGNVLDRMQDLTIGCARLRPVGGLSNSPFIVALADSKVINNHNGIWSPALHEFLVNYVGQLNEVKGTYGWQ